MLSDNLINAHNFRTLEETDRYVGCLESFTLAPHQLRRAGYIVYPLSQFEIEAKRRCGKCCKSLSKSFWRHNDHSSKRSELATRHRSAAADKAQTNDSLFTATARPTANATALARGYEATAVRIVKPSPSVAEPKLRCVYHSGRVFQKRWTCCDGHIFSKPCTHDPEHQVRHYQVGELERNWQFHMTPDETNGSHHLSAVVIDCEMGTAQSGDSELIRLSAVDFFTRKVLLDTLIYPDVTMAHFNTKYSGVTKAAMETARRQKSCLTGRKAARQALWRHIGPKTIVIGHGANSDLTALRWIHPHVIDTLLLEQWMDHPHSMQIESDHAKAIVKAEDTEGPNTSETVPEKSEQPQRRSLSLKALALARLGRHIQKPGHGHDSLEDALATRDLLLWHVLSSTA